MRKREYHKVVLDNGLTLVAERHRHVCSVSIGIWVRVGSSVENPAQSGISHFTEHMLFKGTRKRSSFQIATVLESLGGDLNGFTDKELTCYHATVLKEHVDIALDVLSDLVLHPLFSPSEIEREKKILLQELLMVEDSPEEWITEVLIRNVWKGEPLGQSVVGTKKSIMGITRSQLVKFFCQHYRPENIVVSVAGNVDFSFLKERCEYYFKYQQEQKTIPLHRMPSIYRAKRKNVLANTEHVHLLAGFESVGYLAPGRFELLVMSFLLGGGMSSRLFQEIREKAALAYTVDCDYVPFSASGLFIFYIATSSRSLPQCLEILGSEVDKLKMKPLTSMELDGIKGQLNGAILLASDEMETRQESLGRNEIVFGRYVPLSEIIEEIERVDAKGIQRVANELFVPDKESVFTLGPSVPRKKYLSLFE